MNPKLAMGSILMREGDTQRQGRHIGRGSCDNGGRDWSDVNDAKDCWQYQKLEEAGRIFP